MTILFILALIIYVIICVVLIGLIMMQEGKGGGLSGVMGSSMGETFGFGGASKQIRKYTSVCATVFLCMTIVLTFLGEAALKTTTSQFVGDTSAVPAAPAGVPADGAPATPPVASDATAPNAPQVITVTPAAGNNAPTPGQVPPPAAPPAS